jgi:hypothetical protein
LLCLTHLHTLQIGQDNVAKKPRKGIKSFIHKESLRANREKRLITDVRPLVTSG